MGGQSCSARHPGARPRRGFGRMADRIARILDFPAAAVLGPLLRLAPGHAAGQEAGDGFGENFTAEGGMQDAPDFVGGAVAFLSRCFSHKIAIPA